MKNERQRPLSGILKTLLGGLMAIAAIALFVAPVASNAQETTSSIRGKILDTAGVAVGGASIVVEDQRNGNQRTYTTNSSGIFLATRLLPGGPYVVTVNAVKSVEVASISVGDTYNLVVNLQAQAAIEEIVTIGQSATFVEVASGPSATFNLDDLENAVAFSRDISDVYAVDPRLMIDGDDDAFGLNCNGKHPKFNNITLDGVSQTDRFGLNDNAYSTAFGMPFPYDAISQIAVELAPYDVTYGGFSACNVNSVTKSGANDWEAKAFYEYSSDSFRGDRIGGDSGRFTTPSYDRTKTGFSFGGPILKDKVFVFAAYEEQDDPRFLAKGYAGSGNGEERDWLSEADYNRILNIARNVYDYDPGGQPTDGSQESEKYLVRLDWNISDEHNAALIYNYFDGLQDRDSDGDDDEFEFANHYYTKGAESETITFTLSSQWTDRFSTELFYSTNEFNDSQVTVGPKDFGDFQISVGGRDGTVYLGADDSRQANRLGTESDYIKLSANYLVGDHIITAGYEREDLEIFNIFVQHSNGGEWDFFDDAADDDPACAAFTAAERLAGATSADTDGIPGNEECNLSGIDRFELGRPSRVYYGSGGGSNNPLDAAANFSNVLNSFYIQDEMFFDAIDLTLTAGLRYDWFDSDDSPVFNQAFTDANGIPNNANIDGLDILMPRVGFNWEAREDLTVRGGIGLFSGGNPNVWISNAWSNDGLTNAQYTWSNFGASDTVFPGNPDSEPLSDGGRPGYDVPQVLVDLVAGTTPDDASDENLVLIAPNYKQPSEWKYSIGATWDMPWGGWELETDYMYSVGNDMAFYVDLSQEVIGTTSAGMPIYDYTNGEDNYMLTNANSSPKSSAFSLVFRNEWDNGISLQLGYARIDAEDVVPMTSATAFSNFDNVALHDINNPVSGPSNYSVPNRFTVIFDYEKVFFGDARTRFSIFGYINEGQPQSYVMNGGDLEGDGFFGRHLLYIPDGPDDPNVEFAGTFDQEAFFNWVDDRGLKPGFTKRNQYNAGWSNYWNLRISQEIPMGDRFRGRLYANIYNIGNLLNDDWGNVKDAQFFSPEIVNTDVNDAGQYEFISFRDRPLERTYVGRSLWQAFLGIDIQFGQ